MLAAYDSMNCHLSYYIWVHAWLHKLVSPQKLAEKKINPCTPLVTCGTSQLASTFSPNGSVPRESRGLSSFPSFARSDTTIQVKTSHIEQSLIKFVNLMASWVVPPAGTMVVVEFKRPDEAAKGFCAVAYHQLGNSIICLGKSSVVHIGLTQGQRGSHQRVTWIDLT